MGHTPHKKIKKGMSTREVIVTLITASALLAYAVYAYKQSKPAVAAAAASTAASSLPKTLTPPPAPQEEEHKPVSKPQQVKKPSTAEEKSRDVATKSELAQKESALGTKAFKSGSYSTSVEHFTRAIDLCPETDLGKKVMLNNRAAAREKMLDWQESIRDSTLALDLDPQYRRALVRRAKAYEAVNQLPEALGDLTLVRQLDALNGEEESPEMLASFERLTKQIGTMEAVERWARKKLDQRTQDGKLALPQNLNSVKQYYYSFSHEAGQFRAPPSASAVAAAEEQVDSNDAQAVLALAQMHKYRLDLESAFVLFAQVAATGNDAVKAEALCELASLYHLCGDYLSAKEKLDEAQQVHATTRGCIKLALLAVEDGDFNLAKELTSSVNAEDMHERADLAFHQSAIACIELGDLSLAKELLDQALEGVPDYGLAHMQLGIIHFRLGNTEEALAQLEQSCLMVPELAEVHNFHGEVLMSLGRRDEALSKFMDASTADKHCALPLLNRGVLHMQKEDPSQAPSEEELKLAIELFDQAVEVDPASEIAYVHRASYYGLVGNFDMALENYDKAIQLAKSFTDLQEYCSFRAACSAQRMVQKQFT